MGSLTVNCAPRPTSGHCAMLDTCTDVPSAYSMRYGTDGLVMMMFILNSSFARQHKSIKRAIKGDMICV
jgi:hypothetical protein